MEDFDLGAFNDDLPHAACQVHHCQLFSAQSLHTHTPGACDPQYSLPHSLTCAILLSVAPMAMSKSTVGMEWSSLSGLGLDLCEEVGVHAMQLKEGGLDTISRRKVSVFRSQNSNGFPLYFITR